MYIILFVIVLNFTQPALGEGEASDNKSSDGGSVFLVVVCSALSLLIPIIHWAYFKHETNGEVVILGVVLNIFGLSFRYYSIKILGKFFKATVVLQKEHQLITEGPYKILRHPSYTGALLAFSSISLVLSSFLGFVCSFILMILAYVYRTNREEKALRAHFGEKYIEYSKKTNKLIPYLW
tara:strand:- start:158 stop:697 length:540 start_codon:yes stop_codon:yes gene_type:complete